MKEWYKTIATKVINGHEFVLQIQSVQKQVLACDDNGNYYYDLIDDGYDYIISGPNWLSGNLKAQGMNEQEIFEYWEQVTMQDVKDAWESHYERIALNNYY